MADETPADPSDSTAGAVTSPREPGETVPAHARRVLPRPPGERYAEPLAPSAGGSALRAIVSAAVPAVIGGALLVVLASPLALSEPLVLVALVTGIGIGLASRWGAGSRVPNGRRRWIAVAIALVAISAAEVVIWQLALGEGGVLPIADYLLQTFGPVAPLSVGAAALAAAATA